MGLTQRDSGCGDQEARAALGWSADLTGGHSPEVQVGVAGGGVQPVLCHIAVHVLRGRL